jgi:DNA polymerase III delta prime subunit
MCASPPFIEKFSRLFLQGQWAPCFLFYGAQKVLIEESVRTLSTVILSKNERNPDGLDDVFVKKYLAQGLHPNFFALRPEAGKEEITVEEARRLSLFMQTTPSLPGWRVVVISPANALNNAAANALLKNLEELPPKISLFMIADSLYNLKTTLLSRAQKVFFPCQEDVSPFPEALGRRFSLALRDAVVEKKIPSKECLESFIAPELIEGIRRQGLRFLYDQAFAMPSHTRIWVTKYEQAADFFDSTRNKALAPQHWILAFFAQMTL